MSKQDEWLDAQIADLPPEAAAEFKRNFWENLKLTQELNKDWRANVILNDMRRYVENMSWADNSNARKAANERKLYQSINALRELGKNVVITIDYEEPTEFFTHATKEEQWEADAKTEQTLLAIQAEERQEGEQQ